MKLSEKFMKRFSDICCDHTGVADIDEKFRQMTKRRKRHGFKGMPARLGTDKELKRVLAEFKDDILINDVEEILIEDFEDEWKHWVFDFYKEAGFTFTKFKDGTSIIVEHNCKGQCAVHKC